MADKGITDFFRASFSLITIYRLLQGVFRVLPDLKSFFTVNTRQTKSLASNKAIQNSTRLNTLVV